MSNPISFMAHVACEGPQISVVDLVVAFVLKSLALTNISTVSFNLQFFGLLLYCG